MEDVCRGELAERDAAVLMWLCGQLEGQLRGVPEDEALPDWVAQFGPTLRRQGLAPTLQRDDLAEALAGLGQRLRQALGEPA